MTTARNRYLILIEGLALSGYVALYIWRLQAWWRYSWIFFPIWLILSFILHRDTTKTIGWRGDNLLQATRLCSPLLASFAGAVFVAGTFFGAFHRVPEHLTNPHRFLNYFAFCLLQQVALNSYLMNRFVSVFDRPFYAALLCGAIFGGLHWPNPVLVPLTFVAGTAMCSFFAKERNILPLTAWQSFLGGLVWWAFPLAWQHGMRVGPGFYTYLLPH
jgi:hypothetical protein